MTDIINRIFDADIALKQAKTELLGTWMGPGAVSPELIDQMSLETTRGIMRITRNSPEPTDCEITLEHIGNLNSNPSPTNEGKGTGSASHRHLNPDPARVYLIKALKSLNNEPSTCNDIMQKAIANHGLHEDTPRGSVSKALSGSDFITTRGPNRTNLYALAKYEAVATELQQAVNQQ